MPVHTVSSFGGVDTLAPLVAQVESDGETVVSVMDHGNQWVVVTSKPSRVAAKRAAKKETRVEPGPGGRGQRSAS